MPPQQPSGVPTDQPSDNTTLVEVLNGYQESGFTTTFWSEPDGRVRCDECQSVMQGERLAMHSMRRLEGASDPADMVVVVATTCPVCNAEGTMVLSFGPMGSAQDADVLTSINDRRGDNQLPQNAAPDEVPQKDTA